MRLQNTLFIILFIMTSFSMKAQNIADYLGNWEGEIENSKTFSLKIKIENLGNENSTFNISNSENTSSFPIKTKNEELITLSFDDKLFFEGVLSENGREINGFIKSGILLYHLKLSQSAENIFTGTWNPLMINELKSQNFYLSVEEDENSEHVAYPFLTDNRFTGTWCYNFQQEKEHISFSDFKTGLDFKGKLLANKIQINVYAADYLITQIDLERSTADWVFGGFETENSTSSLQLTEMESLIANDSFPNTHSVLISKNGELIYEKYFDGYNANISHDTRSASKSIGSAIVGIAKEQVLFNSLEQSIFDFIPEKYQDTKDSLKQEIDIQSLLTMSSGLDANDYVRSENSAASEGSYQSSPDWTATVLNASMVNTPNTESNYGSANPYLLGLAMNSITTEPLELFMDKYLFQKLNISNYIIQTDEKGKPYFGGGMYLTPKDMLKFGELYLNKGKLNSERILSKKWVKDSFKNYRVLANVPDKNGYGYLWWHNTYKANGKNIAAIEARGNGGQYIFVIPSLKSVVVVTSGNFGNGKTQQPELIFEKHILPYI